MEKATLFLFEVPPKSRIYCEVSDGSSFVIMDHLDGMYSYCPTEKGGIIHLSVGTPLRYYKDGYKIVEKKETT